jgi:hypothetical protein
MERAKINGIELAHEVVGSGEARCTAPIAGPSDACRSCQSTAHSGASTACATENGYYSALKD